MPMLVAFSPDVVFRWMTIQQRERDRRKKKRRRGYAGRSGAGGCAIDSFLVGFLGVVDVRAKGHPSRRPTP